MGFFAHYPSLALAINGGRQTHFQTHESLSLDHEMRRPFVPGAEHNSQIEFIRTELKRTDIPVHIHVFGEPGIGKTRLVLEATRAAEIKPLVIYSDDAGNLLGSSLLNEILLENNKWFAVLIVDECNDQNRACLWNKLRSRSPRIKLVSIYNESSKGSDLTYIESPQLTEEEIKKIIQEYGVPEFEAGRFARLCVSSPRLAHAVGENLKNNPDEILKSPSTVELWDRFVAGGDPPDSQRVNERRRVLQYIALFKRFGYGPPLTGEAKAISKIIEDSYPEIGWAKFQQIVSELRERKLLQGTATLYISPKLLHIKLWSDWWNIYGINFDLDDFLEKLPPQTKLRDWFFEMFEYAQESQAASDLVQRLLGPDGPFKNTSVLESRGVAFFFRALASARPADGLKCLRRTVGNSNKEQLLKFRNGRREVIYALEHIVFYKDLFLDGARLLLQLAEAENEMWGNNASGVFANLFSPGIGDTAPTSVSPSERLPVLIAALDSDSQEIRKVALRACDQALEAAHFTRHGQHEFAGLRKGPAWMDTQDLR